MVFSVLKVQEVKVVKNFNLKKQSLFRKALNNRCGSAGNTTDQFWPRG